MLQTKLSGTKRSQHRNPCPKPSVAKCPVARCSQHRKSCPKPSVAKCSSHVCSKSMHNINTEQSQPHETSSNNNLYYESLKSTNAITKNKCTILFIVYVFSIMLSIVMYCSSN